MGYNRVLSDAELLRIHDACRTWRDRLLITFFERTGYLPAAVEPLRIEDLLDGDTVTHVLQIRSAYMRGEQVRPPIALHPDLRYALQAYFKERQVKGTYRLDWPLFFGTKSKTCVHGLSREYMWHEFARIAKSAGVESEVGLMSLYKVYTLRIYKDRWDVEFVRKNLGHSEIQTTFALLGSIAQDCQRRDIPLFPNDGLS